jgi:hypothetical protein
MLSVLSIGVKLISFEGVGEQGAEDIMQIERGKKQAYIA